MAHEEERFWQAGATLMEQDGVNRSTMMGLPCLRIQTKFFAAYDRSTGDLMVKLPAARVDQLIADSSGGAVAPAGRRFREWVAIPADDVQQWPDFLAEACAFVGKSPHPPAPSPTAVRRGGNADVEMSRHWQQLSTSAHPLPRTGEGWGEGFVGDGREPTAAHA